MRRVGAGHRQNRLPCHPNANRPDSCARMQAAHREKQNPAISKAETSHAPHSIEWIDRQCTRQDAAGFAWLADISCKCTRSDQLGLAAASSPRRTAAAQGACGASLRFAFRRGHVAGPSPRQLSGPSGVDWVWRHARDPVTALILCALACIACNAAFLMRGAWRAQVHRIIGHIVPRSLTLRSVTDLMLIGCALTSVVSSPTSRALPASFLSSA